MLAHAWIWPMSSLFYHLRSFWRFVAFWANENFRYATKCACFSFFHVDYFFVFTNCCHDSSVKTKTLSALLSSQSLATVCCNFGGGTNWLTWQQRKRGWPATGNDLPLRFFLLLFFLCFCWHFVLLPTSVFWQDNCLNAHTHTYIEKVLLTLRQSDKQLQVTRKVLIGKVSVSK